jgi:hypothetical protein
LKTTPVSDPDQGGRAQIVLGPKLVARCADKAGQVPSGAGAYGDLAKVTPAEAPFAAYLPEDETVKPLNDKITTARNIFKQIQVRVIKPSTGS